MAFININDLPLFVQQGAPTKEQLDQLMDMFRLAINDLEQRLSLKESSDVTFSSEINDAVATLNVLKDNLESLENIQADTNITIDIIQSSILALQQTANEFTASGLLTQINLYIALWGSVSNINNRIISDGETAVDAINNLLDLLEDEEIARAITDTNLANEITNRINADTTLQDHIDAEAITRTNADVGLGGRIDTEITDRTDADDILQDHIDDEVIIRISEDNILQGHINDEAAARVTHENRVDNPHSVTRDQLNVYSKTETDTKFANLIDAAPGVLDTLNELAAAIGDDPNFATTVATNLAAVQANLTSETATRLANDNTEITNRTDADDALDLRIDNEITNRANADNTLQTNINTEITNRTDADDALDLKVNNEITDRANADNVLQGHIDDEVLARFNADNVLQDHIDDEETTRIAAINQEVTDRNAAILVETNARIDADSNLQTNINNEHTAMLAAVLVVQNDINAHEGLTNNPHNVTRSQLNVYSKTEVDVHLNDKNNPHEVTRTQLDVYSTTEVDNLLAALVDSAPGVLDTLNELAAALGDDPNFATTIANQISAIQDNLTTEIGNRTTDVDNEETARISADNTLQNNINTEASTRLAADNQEVIDRNTAISNQETIRIAAEDTLQDHIDNEHTAMLAAVLVVQNDINAHEGLTNNPHNVTAAQVAALALTGGTVSGNVTFQGDVEILGTTTQQPLETLEVVADEIVLNDGITTPRDAKVRVDRGSGNTDFNLLYVESTGEYKAGLVGYEKLIVSIQDSPMNQGIGIYNASNNYFETIAQASAFNKGFGTAAGTVAEGNHTHNYSLDTHTHNLADLIDDTTHRLLTDTERATWNAKATTSYVDTAISNLINTAPGTLDTLNELAAALGDDPNFATTMTTALANKLGLHDKADDSDLFDGHDSSYFSVAHTHPYRADTWVPSWAQVTSKPSTFTPSAHTQAISTITDLQSALDGKVDDSQVLTDVPSGAVFTDTVYNHPDFAETDMSLSTAKVLNTVSIVNGHISAFTTRDLTPSNIGAYTISETDAAITAAINNLVNAAPGALDTLNELAASLGDDADFAGTMTTALAGKASIDHQHTSFDYIASDLAGAIIFDNIDVTNGIVTAIGTRTLTLANLGYTGATDANKYVHPSSHAISFITGLQSALDDKVDDSQVLTNVPSGAVFTDTNTWRGVVDNLSSTLTTQSLSANQGKVLKGYIDTINALLNSDDTTLDELQEIVDYIKQNKTDLDSLGISNIAGLQSALDGKVDDSQVLTNVPSGAVFTDTNTWRGLGETSSLGYPGDKGKIAYDHSQAAHAPSNAQAHIAPTKAEIENVLTGIITSHSHSYLPLSGGTLTGVTTGVASTAYTTRQLRNIIISTGDPSGGSNGDIWIKYS